MLLWLVLCVGCAALAIDEAFAFHEVMDDTIGDDDHFKVILWAMTGVGLSILHRMEGSPRAALIPLLVGYLFHSLYLLVEIGDGDYFRLPLLSLPALKWIEESCELFFLTSYLCAFLVYSGYGQPHHSDAGRSPERVG